jgi:D-3-phosphoglycerate dehydrogenase
MKKGKIIITAPAHPHLVEQFTHEGFDVQYVPSVTYQELSDMVDEATGIVVTTRLPINKELIDRALKLKWIGRLGSGMEVIDEVYAGERGIECISTPEGNRNAVAEHCLGLVLGLMNHICKAYHEVKQGKWLRNENRGIELTGKTVGIVGYGNMGSSFARLLAPFHVRILAYDKYKKGYGNELVTESDLSTIAMEADVISFHVPLTAETWHMAGREFFESLQKKPFYITTCRGAVTDTESLCQAIKEGKISGAALDVLENENLADYTEREMEYFNFLSYHPNVIVTPHIAGYSNEAFLRMSEVLLHKLREKSYLGN